MPRSALRNVAVDHCVALGEIPSLLVRLVQGSAQAARAPVPQQLVREVAINRGEATVDNLRTIGTPSSLTCPDCGGSLWEINDRKPLRYRCHTGDAYSAMSLAHAQKDVSEQALWGTVRALREREMLMRRMATVAAAVGDTAQAAAGRAEAERIREQAEGLESYAECARGTELDATA